jgi:hypothetical protein
VSIAQSPVVSRCWSTTSATDAVADVGDIRCVDHPHDLQLDSAGQLVDEPATGSEQHRVQVNLQLVEDAGFEGSLCRIRAMDLTLRPPAAALA